DRLAGGVERQVLDPAVAEIGKKVGVLVGRWEVRAFIEGSADRTVAPELGTRDWRSLCAEVDDGCIGAGVDTGPRWSVAVLPVDQRTRVHEARGRRGHLL